MVAKVLGHIATLVFNVTKNKSERLKERKNVDSCLKGIGSSTKTLRKPKNVQAKFENFPW